MDVVLEIFDTYLFDALYAKVLPIQTIGHAIAPISTLTAGLWKAYNDPINASTGYDAPVAPLLQTNTWHYSPTSKFFSLEPSQNAYMSRWDRDNIWRQTVSLYIITALFGLVVYFGFASISYVLVFDKATFNHPKYLKNQMRLEIQQTLRGIPVIAFLTIIPFLFEVQGYSFIYDTVSDPGFTHPILSVFGSAWIWLQFPVFFMFTDFGIYWIHRALHSKLLYKRLHKPHHKWIMPTPFASHAFHPLDGFAQSVPYHLFPFIFPLQKFAYIALFTFIQVWTVMIHDGEYVANSPIINGAACHTMHHLYFNYNYGQFTTLWDRLGGSYRKPNEELFVRETKMSDSEWKKQIVEMERVVKEVEGHDDRNYEPDMKGKKLQ